jgi:hypothetical protein
MEAFPEHGHTNEPSRDGGSQRDAGAPAPSGLWVELKDAQFLFL